MGRHKQPPAHRCRVADNQGPDRIGNLGHRPGQQTHGPVHKGTTAHTIVIGHQRAGSSTGPAILHHRAPGRPIANEGAAVPEAKPDSSSRFDDHLRLTVRPLDPFHPFSSPVRERREERGKRTVLREEFLQRGPGASFRTPSSSIPTTARSQDRSRRSPRPEKAVLCSWSRRTPCAAPPRGTRHSTMSQQAQEWAGTWASAVTTAAKNSPVRRIRGKEHPFLGIERPCPAPPGKPDSDPSGRP